jgi:hypothetical protein
VHRIALAYNFADDSSGAATNFLESLIDESNAAVCCIVRRHEMPWAAQKTLFHKDLDKFYHF